MHLLHTRDNASPANIHAHPYRFLAWVCITDLAFVAAAEDTKSDKDAFFAAKK